MRVTTASLAPPAGDPIAELRRAAASDPNAAFRAASLAMRANRDEEAAPLLRAATERFPRDPRLWQMRGLVARNLSDLAEAVAALERARDLAPSDPLIVHGAARARLEAGLPAAEEFARARRLAPVDGSLIQGQAAAHFAAGDVAGAIETIDAILRVQPLWLDGHATLARLRRMAGQTDDLRSYREAVAREQTAPGLWLAWLNTLSLAERFQEIPRVVADARRALGDSPALAQFAAIAADETGDRATAATYFRSPDLSNEPPALVWKVRWLIRSGRWREAADLANAGTGLPGGMILWPYVALAWRVLGDSRWAWLEGDPSFVQVHDLGDAIGDRDALAARLRSLHIAREQPLDQSVRLGTQTDGPLFSRIDPEIARLRAAVTDAVTRYVDALPPPDPSHLLLSAPRRPIRFAGSWSVRLTDGGHHADHVHTHGLISSALYVSLPDAMGGEERAGWLTLGASSRLAPDVAPFREIEPKPGRLVLFPSTMWHGTRPFAAGERLTVAFDVARMG